MEWIKSNLSLVICGAVALAGAIALGMGIFMSDVASAMQQDQSTLASLSSLTPVNTPVIQQAREERAANNRSLQALLASLATRGTHEPLIAEVFPKVAPGNAAAPLNFQVEYRKRQQELLRMLKARDMPTRQEVDREQEALDDQRRKAERELRLGLEERGRTRLGAARTTPLTPPPGQSVRAIRPQREEMTPEQLVNEDPEARAAVRRARSIYCYASIENLDPHPAITDSRTPPSVEDMWYAQMALWIQEDVLGALAMLNEEEAARLPEEQRWVGHLPVKHVQRIVIGDYVPAPTGGGTGMARYSGSRQEGPAGDASLVFTERGSQGNLDVIQFTLDLVVSAQMLPAVIDAICRAGFYTPLLVSYEEEPANTTLTGYIYGSQPTIKAQLQFEGCFLRNKYEKWLPETIKQDIATGQSSRARGTGGGGQRSPVRGPGPGGMQMPPQRLPGSYDLERGS